MIEQIAVDLKGSQYRLFHNSKELAMECTEGFLVVRDGGWKYMFPLYNILEVRVIETKDNKQAET